MDVWLDDRHISSVVDLYTQRAHVIVVEGELREFTLISATPQVIRVGTVSHPVERVIGFSTYMLGKVPRFSLSFVVRHEN